MSAPAFRAPTESVAPRDEVRAVLGAAVVNGFACAELDSRRAVFSRGVCHEHLALYADFRDGQLRSASLIGIWNDVTEIRHRHDHPEEHPFDFIERLVQSVEHIRTAEQTARAADFESPLPNRNATVRLLHSKRNANPQ